MGIDKSRRDHFASGVDRACHRLCVLLADMHSSDTLIDHHAIFEMAMTLTVIGNDV